MRSMKNIVTAVALSVLVGGMGVTAARGQGIFSSSDFSGAGAYDYRLSSALHPSSNADNSRTSNSGAATRNARSGTSRGVVRASSGTTTFRPVGGTIFPQQLAAQFAKTPQDRQELEQLFMKCLNLYEDKARSNGGEVHDVARAMTYFVNINYATVKGVPLSESQFNAMRDEVRTGLLNDDKFQAMSAREKQKMYETMAVMASYVMIGYSDSETKGDAKGLQLFREIAKENLEKLLGVPLSRVRFTDKGLDLK